MATVPTVPSEKDTTKVSFAQAVVDAIAELNTETASSISQLGNGSFEDVSSGEPVLWVVTDNSGGSHSISDATESGGEAHHGQRSLQCVVTGGGGFVEALSDIFLPVGEGNTVAVAGFIRRDTASIRTRIQVLYYDEDLSIVSTDTVYDNSGTGTTYAFTGLAKSEVPATAHFYKINLIAAESGGAIAGNVFFDGFAANIPLRPLETPTIYTVAGADTYTVPIGAETLHIVCVGGGGGGGGSDAVFGAGGGASGNGRGMTPQVVPGNVLIVTVGALGTGGAAGVNGSDGSMSWVAPPGGDLENRYVGGEGGGGGIASSGSAGAGGSSLWNDGQDAPGGNGGDGGDHTYGTKGAGGAGGGGDGGDATGNCAGGGGADNATNAGGNGAPGYIIITPNFI